MPKLKVTTIVPDHGGEGFVIYGPDDDVPAKHAKLIDKSHFEGGDDSDVDDDGVDSREPGTVPPRAGKGSGTEEWRSFAAEQGVDVADDDSRDAIITKCEAAGVVAPAE